MSALIEELNIGIRLLLQQTGSDPEVVFFEDNPRALQLTFILEKILSHGLKDLHIFGKTTFWEFVNHLPECLPAKEAKEKIDMVSSMSKYVLLLFIFPPFFFLFSYFFISFASFFFLRFKKKDQI